MTQFYIYIHRKPDGTPFYVGKGHGKRAYNCRDRNPHHTAILKKYGDAVQIEIIHADSEEHAFQMEREHIAMYREQGYRLANLTDGGEGHLGYKKSEKEKQIVSASLKQFYATEEGKRVNEHLNKHRTGRKNTEETKKKMSQAHTGKKQSFEHRNNHSLAIIGKPKTGYGIGLAGVNWVKSQNCWKVVVCRHGKSVFYGNYKNLLDACARRLTIEIEL